MSPSDPYASTIEVRPAARSDRDQLTALVNAHVASVVPNVSLSVSAVLSHTEREPGEFIEDVWVSERRTLVAVQRHRVVAAAHLVRHSPDRAAPAGIRDHAGLRWFLFWPPAPFWSDSCAAADRLMAACLTVLDHWHPSVVFADGTLPAPGVYGLPEQWPHVLDLIAGVGFVHTGQTEQVLIAPVAALAALPAPDRPVRRTLGTNGTRFALVGRDDAYVEVDTGLDVATHTGRLGEWADVGNLVLPSTPDRSEIGRCLLACAGRWLVLGGVRTLLDYRILDPSDPLGTDGFAEEGWYGDAGFTALTTTRRGWTRPT